jgi:hypothetical protein
MSGFVDSGQATGLESMIDISLERIWYYKLSHEELLSKGCDAEAIFIRGLRLIKSIGLVVDDGLVLGKDDGLDLIIESAGLGHPVAVAMAVLLNTPVHRWTNEYVALKILRGSASRGHVPASHELVSYDAKNSEEMKKLYAPLVAKGYSPSCRAMGKLIAADDPPNIEGANDLFRKGALQHDFKCVISLLNSYRRRARHRKLLLCNCLTRFSKWFFAPRRVAFTFQPPEGLLIENVITRLYGPHSKEDKEVSILWLEKQHPEDIAILLKLGSHTKDFEAVIYSSLPLPIAEEIAFSLLTLTD